MYATLIVSKPSTTDKMRHTIVAQFWGEGSDPAVYTRLTNGKQGRGNAWQESAPAADIELDDLWCEPISVRITNRDVLDVANGIPNTLFTKLVKRVPLDRQSSGQVDSLYDTILDLAKDTPSELAKYDKPVVVIRQETIERMSTTPSLGFVPTFERVGHYIQRSWHGIDEMAMYDYAHKDKVNILFEGPAGSGKTMSPMWYAMMRGWRYVSVQCNIELSASALWGQQHQNPATGRWEFQYGAVSDVVKHGGVLVFDEITAADPRMMMNINSLLDDRRMLVLPENGNEVIEAHPDLIIVAAHNPNYRGTRPMNEALRDRFDIKITYDYDYEIEKQIVKSESILDLAKRMRKMSNPTYTTASSDNVAFETPISPRLLKAFERNALGLNYDFAVDCFVNNFAIEERSSVRMMLEAAEHNIKGDLGLLTETIVTEEPVEA